jgi:hypothetical protein
MTHMQLLDEAVARHNDAEWSRRALDLIRNDQRRSADTHLLRLDLPVLEGIDVYLKDESTHPTGSLKHRLARSLFLYGLCNGHIVEGTPIVEASSGSTADVGGLFRAAAGPALRGGDAGVHRRREGALVEIYGSTACAMVPSAAAYAEVAEALADRARRALHGPVHLCRAGHRLARQQQHRRQIFKQMSASLSPADAGSS